MTDPSSKLSTLSPEAVGELRLHAITSHWFGNTRQLRVWLPPGYSSVENEGRRYPVLYLNDGQNLFDPARADRIPECPHQGKCAEASSRRHDYP